jgi:hypothetical protein
MDSKKYLKEFKKNYKDLIKDKKSGLKKMLIIRPIESESKFLGHLKKNGVEDEDAKKLYDSLQDLLEKRLNKILRIKIWLIFSFFSWFFFTWLFITSFLYPDVLSEIDSKSEFNNSFFQLRNFYFILAKFSGYTSVVLLVVILRVNNILKDGEAIMKISIFAIAITYITIIPYTIYNLNSYARLNVENHLKNSPVKRIPVTISEINYNSWTDDYLKISLKKVNQNDKIPFGYFELSDNVEIDKFKQGDTLHYIISKQYPNVFELRHALGKKVQEM